MPWIQMAEAMFQGYGDAYINWAGGKSHFDLYDPAFITALQHLATSKGCDAFAIRQYYDCGFWLKRFESVSIRTQHLVECNPSDKVTSWYLQDGHWISQPNVDFHGHDIYMMEFRTQQKISIGPWDADFVQAIQRFADSKSYELFAIAKASGIHFKSSSGRPPEPFAHANDTTCWFHRKAKHGVQGLLAPMERNTEELCRASVEEANKDPIPQFGTPAIERATAFLQETIETLDEYISAFTENAIENCSNEQVQERLLKSRESSRRMTLLFGDAHTRFLDHDMDLQISLIESQQTDETCRQTKQLQSFLERFGHADWLGEMMFTPVFSVMLREVIAILEALLQPTKFSLENMPPTFHVLESALAALSRHGFTPHLGSVEHARRLADLTQMLTQAFEDQEVAQNTIRRQRQEKMDQLLRFAETLGKLPASMNKYILIRLSDIDIQDLSPLKEWISRRQFTDAHVMLEAFRDAAVEQKAFRRLSAQLSSHAPSVASSSDVADFEVP